MVHVVSEQTKKRFQWTERGAMTWGTWFAVLFGWRWSSS